ncbi:hypothetical protein J6E39_00935 [bacterium]|nr:hypothetical protein [bacterium]
MELNELKKIKNGIALLVAGFVLFILAIVKVVPDVQKIPGTKEQIKTQTDALEDAKRQLEELKLAEAKKEQESENLLKAFFKPDETGLDSETAMGLEFGEILSSIKQNKIKTRSVKYDYDPADDNFVKNVGNLYHACKVDMELIGSYRNLENFLRDLYKHPHFLEISKIEIIPYNKNKRILIANMQIKLYTQKDSSEQQNSSAPAAQQASPQAPADGNTPPPPAGDTNGTPPPPPAP